MKIISSTLLLATALLCTTANAQDAPREKRNPADRAEQRTEQMTKELALDADQAAKVEAMNKRYAEEMRALEPTEAERQEKREKMKDIQTRRDEELKTVLTEEQYAKMMELRQQRTDERKEHKGGRKGR